MTYATLLEEILAVIPENQPGVWSEVKLRTIKYPGSTVISVGVEVEFYSSVFASSWKRYRLRKKLNRIISMRSRFEFELKESITGYRCTISLSFFLNSYSKEPPPVIIVSSDRQVLHSMFKETTTIYPIASIRSIVNANAETA
jgi:hypothetical protein